MPSRNVKVMLVELVAVHTRAVLMAVKRSSSPLRTLHTGEFSLKAQQSYGAYLSVINMNGRVEVLS
jgi:hypothetical protein